eukprot:jgi/Mesvir1/5996/Mv00745-RA.1
MQICSADNGLIFVASGESGHRRGRKAGPSSTADADVISPVVTDPGKAILRTKAHNNAIAGALAGALVSACLHPVDTVKTCIQAQSAGRSLPDMVVKIIGQRGLRGLYAGLGPNLMTAAPISAIYTATYEGVKERLITRMPKKYHALAHCAAGACASIATSFVYTPSECVKSRMQFHNVYKNSMHAFVTILRTEGVRTLYGGWGAVLCRNVPQSIVKFLTYESLKAFVQRKNGDPDKPLSTLQTLLVGGCAGTTAAMVTTPFDVIKTRLQTQLQGSTGTLRYHGVHDTLQKIVLHEGIGGLYRGVTPRLIIYLTQGALFFASYEMLRRLLHAQMLARIAAMPAAVVPPKGHAGKVPVGTQGGSIS